MSSGIAENAAKAGKDLAEGFHNHSPGLGGSPIQNAFIASKTKEDIFLKNNLEYEQRLKTHLYQFEEERNRKGNQSIDDSQASERGHASRTYNQESPGPGDDTNKLASQPVN